MHHITLYSRGLQNSALTEAGDVSSSYYQLIAGIALCPVSLRVSILSRLLIEICFISTTADDMPLHCNVVDFTAQSRV